MTSLTLPAPGAWRRIRDRAGRIMPAVLGPARARSVPLLRHLKDHAYSIAGLGCISAAGFVHSVFTGLLVTGFLILIFEWKVSE